MSCPRPRLLSLAFVLVTAGCMPSCKNKNEAVGSDLKEAGYQMTPEDWFRASRDNDAQALKKFLSGGFSKDTKDAEGNTALHIAAAAGAENSADFLMRSGVSVDVIGAEGRTPLMAAVMAKKPAMIRWLLRQGANPHLKDADHFKPLMLAVREGSAGSVVELAPYDREDLDGALLMASLLGKTEVIDSLTNYGASVYARMEDGRTPLMLAAQNGHLEAVKLLLDIGASRYAVSEEGKTAATLATEMGHAEVAAAINREPTAKELALETPEQIAAEMDEFVAAAEGESPPEGTGEKSSPPLGAKPPARVSPPIDGAVFKIATPAAAAGKSNRSSAAVTAPITMRHYRESDVPIEVKSISGEVATLKVAGTNSKEIRVKAGDAIPGSTLMVIRVKRRMEDSKVTDGKPMEVSVVEVADRDSGAKREWISGRPSTAHDPIALVEDPVTGERYTATPGQKFHSSDGREYRIADVRPNQIIIEDVAAGTMQTIPLSGPRG